MLKKKCSLLIIPNKISQFLFVDHQVTLSVDILNNSKVGGTLSSVVAPSPSYTFTSTSIQLMAMQMITYEFQLTAHIQKDNETFPINFTFETGKKNYTITLPFIYSASDNIEIDYNDISDKQHIDTGVYGQVFQCSFRQQKVAIKEMMFSSSNPKNFEHFQREIQIIKSLHHPNIVNTIGVITNPDHLSVVMEYVYPGNYSTLIKSKSLSTEHRIHVCKDISSALNYLHEHHLVFRDIKSANVLVTSETLKKTTTCAKLCDFDLCCYEADALPDRQIGTPIYLSPEHWNQVPLTTKSDVFGFGILCYESISNKTPYDTPDFPTPWAIAQFICTGKRLQRPNNTSNELWSIVEKCWDSNPDNRPTMKEVKDSLIQYIQTK
ncbi:Serine/threonine protein kinase HT1 [Entamoeba marina]